MNNLCTFILLSSIKLYLKTCNGHPIFGIKSKPFCPQNLVPRPITCFSSDSVINGSKICTYFTSNKSIPSLYPESKIINLTKLPLILSGLLLNNSIICFFNFTGKGLSYICTLDNNAKFLL